MTLIEAISLLIVLYVTTIGVYRLYLLPVAHIPGPTIAKLTYWYEFYYDVVLGGQYVWKVRDLHKKYGPIVRTNPEEVHVSDASFCDEIYAGSTKKRDRWARYAHAFGLDDSMFGAVEHDLHRARRAPLNPYFSKARIRALQPRIESVVAKLMLRIEEFKDSGKPLPIDLAFVCMTNDIAMQYAFGASLDRINSVDFEPGFTRAIFATSQVSHFAKQFPWIFKLMQLIPERVLLAMNPDMTTYFQIQEMIKTQLTSILAERKGEFQKTTQSADSTIFHEILNSHAPNSEKSFSTLWQNSLLVVMAGTLTTGVTLSTIVLHLLQQPDKLKRLRKELLEAVSDVENPPSLTTLELLPYLTGVIREGLRLSNSVTTRIPTISPDADMMFVHRTGTMQHEHILPAGTPVSMTVMLIHRDPTVYRHPDAFMPERWLDDPGLDRYFLPFLRGSRQCLGINVAYAELYFTIAHLFRRYGSHEVSLSGDKGHLELFQTDAKSIETLGDGFGPIWPADSKGVRIMVSSK